MNISACLFPRMQSAEDALFIARALCAARAGRTKTLGAGKSPCSLATLYASSTSFLRSIAAVSCWAIFSADSLPALRLPSELAPLNQDVKARDRRANGPSVAPVDPSVLRDVVCWLVVVVVVTDGVRCCATVEDAAAAAAMSPATDQEGAGMVARHSALKRSIMGPISRSFHSSSGGGRIVDVLMCS